MKRLKKKTVLLKLHGHQLGLISWMASRYKLFIDNVCAAFTFQNGC
jgi:hypothetical protein